jgi:hypothetical protein
VGVIFCPHCIIPTQEIISLEMRSFASAPLRAAALIALPDFQAMQINDH